MILGLQAAHFRVLLVAGLIAATPFMAVSQGSTFTAIDVPGAGTTALHGTAVTAIDPAGDVAGIYIDAKNTVHGFVRSAGGTPTGFDAPGAGTGSGQGTWATGMDAAGDIAGMYIDSSSTEHGFMRAANGTITAFSVTGAGTSKDQGTIPTCINATGEMAGVYIDANNVVHGFVRSSGGTITTFDAAATSSAQGNPFWGTYVVAIDAAGDVAGAYMDVNTTLIHGFLRAANGTITHIDAPNAGTGANQGTAATAIDPAGDVTGIYVDANSVLHGFLLPAGGAFTVIDAPGAGAGSYQGTYPTGIDAAGDVGGMYTDANNYVYGFVRASSTGTIATFSAPGASPPLTQSKGSSGRLKTLSRRSGRPSGLLLRRQRAVTFLSKTRSLFSRLTRVSPEASGLPGFGSSGNGSGGLYYGTGNFGNLFFNAMNASGEITGIYVDGDTVAHAYLRAANGIVTVFSAPNAGTATEQGTGGLAINTAGTVAGTYADSNSILHGFVFAPSLTATTTALISDTNPSIFGEPVTLTATVASGSGQPPDGETVWFMSGATQAGSQTLTGGTATLTTTNLPVGADSLTAVYGGDLNFAGSTSSAVSQTVKKATSTTTLTSNPNPSTFGQSVILTATVSGQFGGVATGTMTFSYGSESSIVPVGSGAATLTTSLLPEGTDSITAVYSGDSNFAGSTSNTLSQVVQASLAATSFVYTLAGDSVGGYSGDGGPAVAADINGPGKAIVDGAGNLYIADLKNQRIRKVAAGTGVITTIAGTGAAGWSGDNGPAASAQLTYPDSLAFDPAGNLYVADSQNGSIREINMQTGVITTFAGIGTSVCSSGSVGDGGAATNADLCDPNGIAIDTAGNVYIADTYNYRIRKVAAGTGIISTVAGTGSYGYGHGAAIGDGGPATLATFDYPQGIAVDGAGNLYIADVFNSVIRKVTASTGIITTVAGSPTPGYAGDGGPATSAELSYPEDVALDSASNLYILDTDNSVIRKVSASNGTINTIAGSLQDCTLVGDGYPAASAGFCYPYGISIDNSGNLYVADSFQRIRLVTAAGPSPTSQTAAPVFSVTAGTYAAPQTVTMTDATPGASIYVSLGSDSLNPLAYASYNAPIDVTGSVTIYATAVAPGYLPSSQVSSAYTITQPPATVINTVAGNGVYGFSGAGGPATSAELGYLGGLALDGSGNLYFADQTNNVVWSVAAKTGAISIVAGNGKQGNSGYGGPATSTELNYPNGIAVDSAGNLYIAEPSNYTVSKVAASSGIITMYAGNGTNAPCCQGIVGNGGPATAAELSYPSGLAVDSAGNLYIADWNAEEVLKVTASTGIISIVAGNGTLGYSGDGGLATSANLESPSTLALDSAGDLFIGDEVGRVRKVTASTGIITTVAGNGDSGYSGDGGLATGAEIEPYNGIAVDSANNLYISNDNAVRMVSASTGIITTVAGGDFYGYSGDGGSATVAELSGTQGIALDKQGNLYIADAYNYRVREVSALSPAMTTPTVTVTPGSSSISTAQALTVTVAVSGGTGNPTPTGSVTLSSGSYTSTATTLTGGGAYFNIPAGWLSAGADTLTASYTPDSNSASTYNSSTGTSAVTVTQAQTTPAVTITPSSSSITATQALTVTVAVLGGGGNPTPTGTVTLSSGSYSSGSVTLIGGSAPISIAAGALAVGSDTLTATYTPDSNSSSIYNNSAATVTVTVTVTAGSGTGLNNRSFVDTTGNDANNCTASAYCRTFSKALSVTNPGGEVVVVNSGGYGAATISQPVTITAIGIDASVSATTAGDNALTVNTTGNVTIRGLNLLGGGTGNDGILVTQVGFLRIYDMQIGGFANDGIDFFAAGGNLTVYNTKINDCATTGLLVEASGARAYVDGSAFDNDSIAVWSLQGKVNVADSSVHYATIGFYAGGGTVSLFNDRVIYNSVGLVVSGQSFIDGVGQMYGADSLLADNGYALDVGGGGVLSGSNPGTTLVTPGQNANEATSGGQTLQ
ncbi:MAG: Ig-like domain repeat protein [Terracidiphilus sp.]